MKNLDGHMVLGPIKFSEPSEISGATKYDRKKNRIAKVRESRNTRKGITMSE